MKFASHAAWTPNASGLHDTGLANTKTKRQFRDSILKLINVVLDAIEKADEGKLDGLFQAIDFSSEANLGQIKARNGRLKTLLKGFAKPEVDLQAVQNETRDPESRLAETRDKVNFYLKELRINV